MTLRRLPVPIQEQVQLELQQMIRDDVTESVSQSTSWILALIVVKKINGTHIQESRHIRIHVDSSICLESKPLNKALKKSHYRMQTIKDVLSH